MTYALVTMKLRERATTVEAERDPPTQRPPKRQRNKPPPTDAPPDEPERPQEEPESDDALTRIRQAYATDTWFDKPQNTAHLEDRDGFWWWGQQLVISDAPTLKELILWEMHDAPSCGHGGRDKTIEQVKRHYWWPRLDADVEAYVRSCTACQRNKASNQRPVGLLQPLPTPTQPWESVSMDFIVQLPRTKRGHDAIIVFVDRLTKMVHFAPTTTKVDAEDTARLFLHNVVRLHGPPESIISDRGSTFNSTFFREFARLWGSRMAMSTAYHPQTDGQTERVNRVLEDMLRHYTNPLQDNWDDCLDAAEVAVNNSRHASINTTPFRLQYGFNPPWSPGKVMRVNDWADRIQRGLQDAKQALAAAKDRQKLYADKKRRPLELRPGDRVMLSSKNLSLKSPGSAKLLPKWIGPFLVIRKINEVAFKLELPPSYLIHDVFHISLLKPFVESARSQPLPPPIELEGELYYTIERILDHRETLRKGKITKRDNLIKWQHYGAEHNSWEPERALLNDSPTAVREYWETTPTSTRF